MQSVRPFLVAVSLAAAVQIGYLLRMDLPVFDPWRHLLVIANLRAGKGFTVFDGQP